MKEPTLPELLREDAGRWRRLRQRQARGPSAASRRLAAARLAYQAAKVLDDADVPITQDEADYVCSIIATRMVTRGGQWLTKMKHPIRRASRTGQMLLLTKRLARTVAVLITVAIHSRRARLCRAWVVRLPGRHRARRGKV